MVGESKNKKYELVLVNKSITSYVNECHNTSVEKGFYDCVDETDERFIGTQIALMHSELSEALEALRDNKIELYFEKNKPEGMVVELADCIIRIFDLCGALNLNIDMALLEKMEYNKNRDYKHGRENF